MINSKKAKGMIIAAMAILLLIQMTVLLYYGTQKEGFHEDEFYSYYSTNKTAGLVVNDREWMERDSYRNDFVVLEGEGFRYRVVSMMQSWDVHPPLYYFVLHTVCSLFPEIFSKWLGIAVNMIAYVPCFVLLWYLCFTTVMSGARDERKKQTAVYLSSLTCMVWGFSAAVISGVMFIRMYQWLTLFVLLCACIHVRAIKQGERKLLSFYLPLMITVYMGFLTQYYYIIFHVFLGTGFCFLLLKNKKIKDVLCYGISCVISLLLAICSYPASLSHIFRGYRGTEAVSEFANASNTWERIRFFMGLFNDYVFHGTLILWVLLICLILVTEGYIRKRRQINSAVTILLFACIGYFFTISKTALLLGETSNRYQLPIYGMVIFLILYLLCIPLLHMLEGKRIPQRLVYLGGAALAVALLTIEVSALKNDKVFFLYREEAPTKEYVKENSGIPVVVLYNEASPANVWRLSDELMEFPRIYLASQGEEPITDETVVNSPKLLVYAADYEGKDNCLESLMEQNKKLTEYKVIAQKGLWTLYEFNS